MSLPGSQPRRTCMISFFLERKESAPQNIISILTQGTTYDFTPSALLKLETTKSLPLLYFITNNLSLNNKTYEFFLN